jgi:hypothetical protein
MRGCSGGAAAASALVRLKRLIRIQFEASLGVGYGWKVVIVLQPAGESFGSGGSCGWEFADSRPRVDRLSKGSGVE